MKTLERNKIRTGVARKIRALREARHWTQADLSKRLGLSQSRFSEIERGQGSFTAEQFLEILKLFNVPVTHFAPGQKGSGSEIQNALARLWTLQPDDRMQALRASLAAEARTPGRPEPPRRRPGAGKVLASDPPLRSPDALDELPIRIEGQGRSKPIDMDWD